jgi:glyoxylase-like metal-dependent hydrolase (beta-lactamase superfamily II)
MPASHSSPTADLQETFRRAGLVVLERGWLSSNSVLFPRGADTVLVDTGYASHAAQTVALVRHALRGRRLDRIVNTHLHSDHCGGNAALQVEWGSAVAVPAGEAATVDRWDETALTYRYTGQHCPRFQRTDAIAAGDRVRLGDRTWEAIASPGHDPQSFVLHDAELGLLLSADALWERGFGIVFPEIEGAPGFADVRATLVRLRTLRVTAVIPGHGAPFTDVDAALDRADALLERLEADPARHARHAAKVLVKYHLMDARAQPEGELRAWLAATPCLHAAHSIAAGAAAYDEWAAGIVTELVEAGALRRDGAMVRDA